MSSLPQAVYAHLTADTAITDIVGTRVRPTQGYVKDPLPLIIYEISNDVAYEESSATSRMRECLLSLKLYGTDYAVLVALKLAVREAMQVKHALFGSIYHATVFNLGEDDGAEFPMQGQNSAPYMLLMNFSVQYALP